MRERLKTDIYKMLELNIMFPEGQAESHVDRDSYSARCWFK